MEDEQVESATTETTETETPEEAATSAETENTEGGTKGPIPYDRFKEVNDRYKTAREEAEALAAERDALQRRVDEMSLAQKRPEVDTGAGKDELPTPPAGLSERQTVEWYVREDAKRLLESEFGMSLKDVATLIRSVPQAANYAQERQWESLCHKHGLDPNDNGVRKVATGLLYSAGENADPDKVISEVAQILGAKKTAPSTKPPSPSRVETDGMGSQLTVTDFMPSSKEEAVKAAKEGKRVPFISTSEILRRKQIERAKRG